MSLFDIIKYSNTDICDEDELEKLPVHLLILYWNKTAPGGNHGLALSRKIRHLSIYASMPSRVDNQKKLFKEALEEYNNEPI